MRRAGRAVLAAFDVAAVLVGVGALALGLGPALGVLDVAVERAGDWLARSL